jgi:hypothetical protein
MEAFNPSRTCARPSGFGSSLKHDTKNFDVWVTKSCRSPRFRESQAANADPGAAYPAACDDSPIV